MSYKVFDMCMENNSPCKKEDCEFYKEQRRCAKYKLAIVCKYQESKSTLKMSKYGILL